MDWKVGHIHPYWPKIWPIHLLPMGPVMGYLPSILFTPPAQIAWLLLIFLLLLQIARLILLFLPLLQISQLLLLFLLPLLPTFLYYRLPLLVVGVAHLLFLPAGRCFLGASPASLIVMLAGPISCIFLDARVHWWHVYVLGMVWSILHLSWQLALPNCSVAG